MDLKLIDIHTHVNFNAFRDDGDEVMRRTLAGGVGMILVGSQYDTSARAIEYAERYPEAAWAAIGLHPIHVGGEIHVDAEEISTSGVPGFSSRPEEFDYKKYKTLAMHPKTVAIGECGLDYFRSGGTQVEREKQFEVLRGHIKLAREVQKPLIIHCRNAYDDLHKILIEEHAGEVGGTIHFFAGTWSDAQKFLDLGFGLSFTGVITFARDYDETVKNMPLDRIMVETDAPYVAPVPYRGRRNEPLYVEEIAKKVAELRGISFDEVAKATVSNASRIFHLK
ncbi:MAG: TatD family deoxyribonuclease [Candidatus Ryanbacteria bacterium]|nr:TatD family deoxyribonuclease [Candidatus Ryanbacteria bacterium]